MPLIGDPNAIARPHVAPEQHPDGASIALKGGAAVRQKYGTNYRPLTAAMWVSTLAVSAQSFPCRNRCRKDSIGGVSPLSFGSII